MVRLRYAVMAVALGTGVMGCALSQSHVAHYSIWHCDECDDFPTPAYGPGNTMMPGTYTGAPPRDRPEANQPGNSTPDLGAVPPPTQPAATTPLPAAPTPPTPPSASPGQGAAVRPSGGAAGFVSAVTTSADLDSPPLPGASQGTLPIPVAQP